MRPSAATAPPPAPALAALLLLALALVLALPLAPGAGAQETRQQEEGTKVIGPRNVYHPLPASMKVGDALVWDWRVADPPDTSVHFSSHIHDGPRLINISEHTGPSHKGRTVADRAGLYSVIWENLGVESVTITYEFHVEPAPPPPKPAPLPWALAVGALAGIALLARRRGR